MYISINVHVCVCVCVFVCIYIWARLLYTLTRTKMPRILLSVYYSLQTKGVQLYSKHVFVTAISLCNEQNPNFFL